MKKLLSLFILMLLPMLASAQTASDVQNSGCLSKTRGEETQWEPTIILTKEGSTLSVQLLNYESNCATQDFNVSSSINGEGGIYGVSVDINPVLPEEAYWCLCPFNISFTIHDMEPNNFYFNCWLPLGLLSSCLTQTAAVLHVRSCLGTCQHWQERQDE